jgi:hypothetical protein
MMSFQGVCFERLNVDWIVSLSTYVLAFVNATLLET